jgi:hypothetical protein
MEVRSYRHVFDLERRIYRIDVLRLNPGGVPVRALGYLAAFLVLALLAGRVPLLGTAWGILPWPVRDVAVPALAAFAGSAVRVEGRSFRHGLGALLRACAFPGAAELGRSPEPRRWEPPGLVFLPDGSDARLRRMTYAGPGLARIHIRHGWQIHRGLPGRAGTLTLLAGDDGLHAQAPRTIALDAGASLVVRPDRSSL